jgi:hypothetical protein
MKKNTEKIEKWRKPHCQYPKQHIKISRQQNSY